MSLIFCLVLFDNTQATVYINELKVCFNTIATKSLEMGQKADFNNVIGVSTLFFDGLDIALDKSIIFYFCHDWKRGIYYNFGPNNPTNSELLINIERKLGMCFEYLLYSHIFKYSNDVLSQAYGLGWFQFIALLSDVVGQNHLTFLFDRINEKKSTQNAEQRLVDFFDEKQLKILLERIQKIPALQNHIKFIEVGVEDYLKGGETNYLRAGSALYPRIEGILGDLLYQQKNPKKNPTTRDLGTNLETIIYSINEIPGIYFPTHFVKYLKNVFEYYFSSRLSNV